MLTTPAHLVLSLSHQLQDCRLVGEFGINRQSFDCHANRTGKAFVGTTIINGIEQTFLLVIELRQQEGIGGREQRALEHTILFAVVIHTLQVNREGAQHAILAALRLFQVRHELGESVATVKIGCIPFLCLFKCWRFTSIGFDLSQLHQCHLLRGNFLTVVGPVDIL